MAATKSKGFPKRFDPFVGQARTQGALRYGAQESALSSIFDDTTRRYAQQSLAQESAYRSLLGSLQRAPAQLQQGYTDAGLSPNVLQSLAGTPEGVRLMGSQARASTDLQMQRLGAEQGQRFIQGKLADDYRSDVGKLNQQKVAMATERGLYESGLLDELIGQDRSRRSEINAAARKQQFDADQALEQRGQSERNALIGAGLNPDTGAPLPARSKTAGKVKAASPATIKAAAGTFSQIRSLVQAQWEHGIGRKAAGQSLLRGRKGTKGEKVYDPVTGKPKLDPKTGTQVTTGAKSEVPSFAKDQPLLQAALDLAYDGHVSPATVRLLHKAYGNGIVGALRLNTKRGTPRPQRPQPTPTGVFAPGSVQPQTIG
ncbi:MAG TPA: hypothetical protein VNS09_26260 [Solirubrobacter sp.]|nr:hypothetical protein [Solirubrobacter sp.]